MRRGDLITVSVQGNYGKPRPALVLQSDLFSEHDSVTVLLLTSELRDTPLFRVTIEPDEINQLSKRSQVMVDKAVTMPREKLGDVFGRLEGELMISVNRAMAVFLGIA
ncbi:growth inhibitor PemK [Caballeronia udeis]|uniref:Growth inhibitor PemK n=1 Tax=Caballeronia udeis TaxID=1232866 RepID=A0A158F5L4_9BURK|nr:type II toxin-antitoxin system PemK/MazF family toxin [Caballeronia udeis]SAL15156.1 growth inhibitor PemK [Caballeronia udeis]